MGKSQRALTLKDNNKDKFRRYKTNGTIIPHNMYEGWCITLLKAFHSPGDLTRRAERERLHLDFVSQTYIFIMFIIAAKRKR